jgi:hypothetical protein
MAKEIITGENKYLSTGESISIKIIEDAKELNENFNSLDKISVDPVTDLDYIRYQLANSSTPKKLLLVSINNKGTLSGCIVGFIQLRPVYVKLGFKTIFKLKAKCLVIPNGGIIGSIPQQLIPDIFINLRKYLRRVRVDYIYFRSLRIDSEFYKSINEEISFIYRDFMIDSKVRFGIDLPNLFEEYLCHLSRKTRANYRNAESRVIKSFKEDYSIKYYCHESEIEKILIDVERIASKSWQRKSNIGFRYTAELHKNWEYFARRKWLSVFIMYLNEKPVAYWSGLVFKKKYFGLANGYDPKYQFYQPGKYSFLKMINEYCSNKEVEYIDLGLIDMQYKRELATVIWEEAPIYIFTRSVNGFILFLSQNIVSGLNSFITYILSHLGLLDKVKNDLRKKNNPLNNKLSNNEKDNMAHALH